MSILSQRGQEEQTQEAISANESVPEEGGAN